MNPAPRAPILSLQPIVLATPGRPVDLELRVTAPTTGDQLPVLLLSHGHGPSNFLSSLFGYGPLADRYGARGFVVIQPTHLDSKTLSLRSSDHSDAPLFWRARADDMSRILDQLDAVVSAVPTLAGRVDSSRVGVVGHSMGGHTASVLLGAQHTDPRTGVALRVADARIQAGVILAGPGRGEALSAYAAEHYPFLSTLDFTTMTTPALVVAGDADDHPFMKTVGAPWHEDPYRLAPGPKALLTLFGGQHGLGGIAGYDAAETTDESTERVEAVGHLTSAYLRSQLVAGDRAWSEAQARLASQTTPIARIEAK